MYAKYFYSSQAVSFGYNLEKLKEYVIPRSPNLVPRAFPLKKWVGREKALPSAGHVHSLNIPEKLIYVQPAGFALTRWQKGVKMEKKAVFTWLS